MSDYDLYKRMKTLSQAIESHVRNNDPYSSVSVNEIAELLLELSGIVLEICKKRADGN